MNHALVGTTLANNGGFERGKVAELWGPSGAGKTGLAYVERTRCSQIDFLLTAIVASKLLLRQSRKAILSSGLVCEVTLLQSIR